LNFGSALNLNQNLFFEMASNVKTKMVIQKD